MRLGLASLAGVFVLCLGGCAVDIYGGDARETLRNFEHKLANVATPGANRDAVRASLGTPFAASLAWGVDLYRVSAVLSATTVAVTPWPVPFWHRTHSLLGHAILRYDSSGALTSGAARTAEAGWSPAIRAGEFVWHIDGQDGVGTLLLAPNAAMALDDLAKRSGHCVAVVGILGMSSVGSLSVDQIVVPWHPLLASQVAGWAVAGAPERIATQFSLSVDASAGAFVVPAGTHVIRAMDPRVTGPDSVMWDCEDGETVSIAVDVREQRASHVTGPAQLGLGFRVTPGLSRELANRYLVLYRGGQWLADPAGFVSR